MPCSSGPGLKETSSPWLHFDRKLCKVEKYKYSREYTRVHENAKHFERSRQKRVLTYFNFWTIFCNILNALLFLLVEIAFKRFYNYSFRQFATTMENTSNLSSVCDMLAVPSCSVSLSDSHPVVVVVNTGVTFDTRIYGP